MNNATKRRIVGITEIGAMLGVSRQRAWQLKNSKGFPKPYEELSTGPVWRTAAIEGWAKRDGRTV